LEEGEEKDTVALMKAKKVFGHDNYFHGYVTSDKSEYDKLIAEGHEHILFVDRSGSEKYFAPIKHISDLMSFNSTVNNEELDCYTAACFCTECCHGRPCPHIHISGKKQTSKTKTSNATDFEFTLLDANNKSSIKKADRVILDETLGTSVMGENSESKLINKGTIVLVSVGTEDEGVIGVFMGNGSKGKGWAKVKFYVPSADKKAYSIPNASVASVEIDCNRMVIATVSGGAIPQKICLGSSVLQLIENEVDLFGTEDDGSDVIVEQGDEENVQSYAFQKDHDEDSALPNYGQDDDDENDS
jgi:hypothetical protein